MPASIAATCCGVSGARQSRAATSPTNSGCSGRMDRLMPLSLSKHFSAAEPIAVAAARQCRRRRRKTRRAGVYKAGETAAGGAGKGGAAVGEAAFLPRPAAGAALRRLLAWLTAARILRRNTLELFPPEAFAEEVVHRRSLGRDQIILSQPAAIHRILVENPHNYGRTAATMRILRPLLGEGLLLSEGEEWARQRRAHAPAFAPRMVPLLARRVAEAAEATIAELAAADGAPVDLLAALQKLALDVAGRVLFSLDMRPFAAPLRALVERYGDGLGRPRLLDFLLPPTVPSPHDLLRRRLRRRWLALVARIIAARRALPEPDPPDLFAPRAAANSGSSTRSRRCCSPATKRRRRRCSGRCCCCATTRPRPHASAPRPPAAISARTARRQACRRSPSPAPSCTRRCGSTRPPSRSCASPEGTTAPATSRCRPERSC